MNEVRIKVCGFTDSSEAVQALELGVDWIGLNFHPASPRYLTEEAARAILDRLAAPESAVGLFVNRSSQEILGCCQRLGLRIVQLHGEEPPETLAELCDAGLEVIRAWRLKDTSSINELPRYLERCNRRNAAPFAILLDSYIAGQQGGTGRVIMPELLRQLPAMSRVILAGGLNPGNVRERIALCHPWMVDVASGVETAPGRKDRALVEAFVRAVKLAQGGESQVPPGVS